MKAIVGFVLVGLGGDQLAALCPRWFAGQIQESAHHKETPRAAMFMNPSNKGRFYHDGRFATLLDVVNHYNVHFNLGLTNREKLDLVEYLKSLPSPD